MFYGATASQYQRWLLALATLNAKAGEDIRYLPRHLAGDVPADSFWLLDDETAIEVPLKEGAYRGVPAI